MSNDAERAPLPFEPIRKRKKSSNDAIASVSKAAGSSSPPANSDARATPKVSQAVAKARLRNKAQPSAKTQRPSVRREDTSIPEVVSNRMLRRMAYFSGIPVSLGVLIFFVSYVLITRDIVDLPNVVVLLSTLACFGLSVVGLSYGALSASWEEETLGSLLGTEQFQVNFERLVGSWKQAREERRNNS